MIPLYTRSKRERLRGPVILAMLLAALTPRPTLAEPTVEELLTLLDKQRAAFHAQSSYRFEFRIDSKNSPVVCKHKYLNRTHTVINIRRGKDLFVRAHNPRGSRIDEKDSRERTIHRIFYHDAAVDFNGFHYTISPQLFTQHFQGFDYTDLQHIDTYRNLPRPAGNVLPFQPTQPFLPETIRKSPKEYRVRPEQQSIDGVFCWVIERPGVDIIWLDGEGLIRRRELHWGPGEPRSTITHLRDYRTVASGLKLPMKIVAQNFTDPRVDPQEIWDQLAYELTVTLLRYEFNNVRDEDFIVKPPPGVFVHDHIRRVKYQVMSPDQQPFQTAIGYALANKPGGSRWLILVSGLLAGVLLIVVLLRRLRQLRRARAQTGARQ